MLTKNVIITITARRAVHPKAIPARAPVDVPWPLLSWTVLPLPLLPSSLCGWNVVFGSLIGHFICSTEDSFKETKEMSLWAWKETIVYVESEKDGKMLIDDTSYSEKRQQISKGDLLPRNGGMDGSYPKSEWPTVRSRKPFIYNKIPSLPLKHISELAQYGCFNGTSSLSFLHQKQPTTPTHDCELFLFLQLGSKHFSNPGVGFRSLHFILGTGELWRSVFFSGADGGQIGMLKIMQSKLKVGFSKYCFVSIDY